MTYKSWHDDHRAKRNALISDLKVSGLSDDEIVHYFRWTNMVKVQKEYCGLYKDMKKCHTLNELNCLFCACPYFVYSDEGLDVQEDGVLYSKCSIDSRLGTTFEYDNCLHQDCTLCLIPHTKHFAFKYFFENKDDFELKD